MCAHLLDHGALVNEKTKQGYSPLYLACTKGFKDVILLLVAKGATWECSIPKTSSLQHIPVDGRRNISSLLIFIVDPPIPQAVPDSLIKDVSSLLDNPIFSDVTLKVDGTEFKAHKCVLAARFEFLESGSFTSKEQNFLRICFSNKMQTR